MALEQVGRSHNVNMIHDDEAEGGGGENGNGMVFRNFKDYSSKPLLPNGPQLQILFKSTNWGASIQIYEPLEVILIQTTQKCSS